ncbi:MAG: cupin domain-containing protein [Solirubrobacterales bacterium]
MSTSTREENAREAANADRHLDFHPGMGMRWEITRSTEDTDGELFEHIDWYDAREPGPLPHVHPGTEDSFEVLEGALEVCIDGEWVSLGPGETATVPPGVPHTFRNATDGPVQVVCRHRPAGRAEAFFRDMHRLIEEGRIKHLPPKDPRSAIYAAMLIHAYPDEIRVVKPPNGLFTTMAAVGRALRFTL